MTVIVIGAGLAGLSCALALADAGHEVELHEAAPQAGGRCRSWFDARLGAEIDNGSHLIAGGNHAVWRYLRRIQAEDSLQALPAALPMLDLASGRRWTANPLSLLPTLLASPLRLAVGDDTTVETALGGSRRYRDFWHPLALAVLNTDPAMAQAKLLRQVAKRTLWRGAAASRLYQPRRSLSASFVDPALRALDQAGVAIRFRHPLRSLIRNGERVEEIGFDDQTRRLSRHDRLVLALPPWSARRFLPNLPELPSSPICNLHLRLDVSKMEQPPSIALGLINGMAQWLFYRNGVLSVTLSGQDAADERSVGKITEDINSALQIKEFSAFRLIRERRATLLHTSETEKRRHHSQAAANIILAGDWSFQGLPCSLEAAILSGERAARLASGR